MASNVRIRPYISSSLVFLAMDWPEGENHADFLGFSIQRNPGHGKSGKPTYLFNKSKFTGQQQPQKKPLGSDKAPIQKFIWWDSGINVEDRGRTFRYTVWPVLGTGEKDLEPQNDAKATCEVTIPREEDGDVATWFNRAVVSSQSFNSTFRRKGKPLNVKAAMTWLANGMENAFADIAGRASTRMEVAAYHLTDGRWVVPMLRGYKKPRDLVYYMKYAPKKRKPGSKNPPQTDLVNAYAARLFTKKTAHERLKANIMHDKFIVAFDGTGPSAVLMGSANFTPEGLTTQANLIHVIGSRKLAKLYSTRQRLLAGDPSIAVTAKSAGWSAVIPVGKARIRVHFPPEAGKDRKSIDAVVKAIRGAKKSVLFCLFSPTDSDLLNAILDAGDQKKMMFGLLNSIKDPSKRKDADEALENPTPSVEIEVKVFHRSRSDAKVLPYNYFRPGRTPTGWLPELSTVDVSSASIVPPRKNPKVVGKGKKGGIPAVHIHHKFIILDAETKNPTIFTGSANMSNNAVHRNDENLLEIKGDLSLAQLYLAEFFRLYEHYRARALWNYYHDKTKSSPKKDDPFALKTTRDAWVKGAYRSGTRTYFQRVNLAAPPG